MVVIWIRNRVKLAIVVSQKAQHFARLAQISFDFAQDKLSRRKRGWLGMTTSHKSQAPATHCTRKSPLPLLPSGPGGVGGNASRETDA